ncbi:hypothetical protein ACFV0D_37470, partial [Streptomyces sp. NPDC059556]
GPGEPGPLAPPPPPGAGEAGGGGGGRAPRAARGPRDRVDCSPHLFLPDGSDHANPGIEVDWEGAYGIGWPVIGSDDPKVFEDILLKAATE